MRQGEISRFDGLSVFILGARKPSDYALPKTTRERENQVENKKGSGRATLDIDKPIDPEESRRAE